MGWTGHNYRQGSAEYFGGGFELQGSVFWGVLVATAVFLELLNKSCIFDVFYIILYMPSPPPETNYVVRLLCV